MPARASERLPSVDDRRPSVSGVGRGRRTALNLPNLLSISRILLVPLLVVVLLTETEDREFIGLGLFLLAALTDFLDGFIARRQRQVTQLGKLLDPAADKILMSAAFISLVELELAPAWMVVVIMAREFAVSALRSLAAAQNVVLAAGVSGKIKTSVQVVTISVLIVSDRFIELKLVAPVILWLAVLVTIYSGVEYFVRFGRLAITEPAPPPTDDSR